ncbi:MAG: LysR family transcriptional regulator [Sulfobacillus sp.]|nr:LysR family transcriptional regulator [Sulfobacillus sp.]
MTLKQLQFLVAVSNHGSLSGAADALGLSQPAITGQLQALERELGRTLFVRAARGVHLTAAGLTVLQRAQRILSEVSLIVEDMNAAGQQIRGTVTLGMSPLSPVSIAHFPTLYRKFHQNYPDVQVDVVEVGAATLADRVKKGQVDLALMPLPILATNLVFEPLWSEELVAIVPHQDGRFGFPELPLSDLKDYPFVFMKPGFGLNHTVIRLTQDAGFVPQVVQEVSTIGAMIGFVAAGIGVAIVPREAIRQEDAVDRITVLSLTPPARRDFALVYRSWDDLSRVAQQLAKSILDYGRQLDRQKKQSR